MDPSFEVIAGRLYLIPAKGLLENLKPEIMSKFRGSFKYISDSFEIPSRKAPFEIEVVVDDECEVCPIAVEAVAELVAKYENITAKIYNMTYTNPPWEVTATPDFRINGRVKFTGIPLDQREINKHFSKTLREAYVLTHPKLEWLVNRLREFGERHGLRRNPNDVAYMNLIYKLLKNIDEYGYPFCPCRPLKRVEGATPEQIYELNKDKVCPCTYALADIARMGHCICGMFWTREKVDEYIKQRLERYGWIVKEIDTMQSMLSELKKRIVTGRAREVAEALLYKVQLIFSGLPDE